MDYQKFPTPTAARDAVPYNLLLVDNLLDMPRRTAIRWIDSRTDMFFQTYIGLEAVPGTSNFVASKRLLVVQGWGVRCNTAIELAPAAQRGEIALPDGRKGVWAVGLPSENWAPEGPTWAAWKSIGGATFVRVEGVGFDLPFIQTAARVVAAMESAE